DFPGVGDAQDGAAADHLADPGSALRRNHGRRAGVGGRLMQAIRSLITARLQADQTLYPNLAPGGVWDRPLAAGNGRGSTPAAFWIAPADPTKPPRLRRSLVVLDGGEVPATDGPDNARLSFPRIFFYVPATATDKAALDDIDGRVRWLLDPANWRPALA